GPGAFDAMLAFSGVGRLQAAPGSVAAPMPATVTSGQLAAGPGAAWLPLAFGGTPIWVPMIGARVRAQVTPRTLSSGVLCGAITQQVIDTQVIPSVTMLVNQLLVQGGSNAQTICQLFDADMSCSGGGSASGCAAFSAQNPPLANCITLSE